MHLLRGEEDLFLREAGRSGLESAVRGSETASVEPAFGRASASAGTGAVRRVVQLQRGSADLQLRQVRRRTVGREVISVPRRVGKADGEIRQGRNGVDSLSVEERCQRRERQQQQRQSLTA